MKGLRFFLFRMFAPLGIPLAWRQLTRDRKRFATAIIGVTFGVVLMLYQLGLYTAFLRMVVFPHSMLKGELIITSRSYAYFYHNRFFSRRILYEVQSFPGVASIAPLQVNFLKWKNTTTGVDMVIAVLACNPSQNPFVVPELEKGVQLLKNGENVLFDRQSAGADFGKVAEAFEREGEVVSELEHVRVSVQGLFSMGRTLAATGHIITSDQAFGRIYPQRPANMINMGLITLTKGADPEEVRARLSAFLTKDVRIVTSSEFRRAEQSYWMSRTAVGFICIAGMLVGMCVGGIVVYQILYTDVTDHLREYATLKALGITDWFLFRIIMTEALILLLTSFLPSALLSGVMFHVTRLGAGMPTKLAAPEVLIVFCMAAAMCVLSGFLATRKLKTADPADIF